MADAAVMQQLAPTGKLRAAINLGNSVLAQTDRQDRRAQGHHARSRARTRASGWALPVELIPYDAAGKVFDARRHRRLGYRLCRDRAGARRRDRIHRALRHHRGHLHGAEGFALKAIADVDRPGVRIAVGLKSAYDLYLTRTIKNATIVRAAAGGGKAMIDLFINDKLEVAAGVKQPLVAYAKDHPEMRVMDGHFMEIQQAMGTPKGRTGRRGLFARLRRGDESLGLCRRGAQAQQPDGGGRRRRRVSLAVRLGSVRLG